MTTPNKSTGSKHCAEMADRNADGLLTTDEIKAHEEITNITIGEKRQSAQRKMAWVAIASMVFFTCILFTPLVTESRVEALGDLIGLFYIAQAGVVGAFMGTTAWMSRN